MGELLKKAKQFIEDGISPPVIINGYWNALLKDKEKLRNCTINIECINYEEKKIY